MLNIFISFVMYFGKHLLTSSQALLNLERLQCKPGMEKTDPRIVAKIFQKLQLLLWRQMVPISSLCCTFHSITIAGLEGKTRSLTFGYTCMTEALAIISPVIGINLQKLLAKGQKMLKMVNGYLKWERTWG